LAAPSGLTRSRRRLRNGFRARPPVASALKSWSAISLFLLSLHRSPAKLSKPATCKVVVTPAWSICSTT